MTRPVWRGSSGFRLMRFSKRSSFRSSEATPTLCGTLILSRSSVSLVGTYRRSVVHRITSIVAVFIVCLSPVAAGAGCGRGESDHASARGSGKQLDLTRRALTSRLRIDVPEVSLSSVRPVSSTTYVSMSDATGIEVGRVLPDGVTDQGVLAGSFVGARTDVLRLFDALEGLEGRARRNQPTGSTSFDEVQVVPTVRQDAPASRPLFVGDVHLRAKWGLELAFASAREIIPAVSSDDRFHAQAFQLAFRPIFNPDSVRPSAYVLVSFGEHDARVRRVENGKVAAGTIWYGAADAVEIAKGVRNVIGDAHLDAMVLVRADASYDQMIHLVDDLAALHLPSITLIKADPAEQIETETDASDLVLGPGVTTIPVPELDRRVRTHANKLLWCYWEQLKSRPDVGEKRFQATWVVEPNGQVKDLKVTGDDREVADCLAVALGYVEPRRQPNGTSATVTYPMEFTRRRSDRGLPP